MASISTPHHGAAAAISPSTFSTSHGDFHRLSNKFSLPFLSNPFPYIPIKSFILRAKKKNPPSPKLLNPSLVEEVLADDDFDEFFDDEDDAYFEDQFLMEEEDIQQVGDGGGGGGISLAGTKWDKEALAIAEEVSQSFGGDLAIYAFKTLLNFTIRVRIERLTNKSGSPTMEDVEAFSIAYRKRLDEAEVAGTIPENLSLEVSSPGVERIVRIPENLERFKERAMYVKYVTEESSTEFDGVLRLLSFDVDTKTCTWGIADVKVNREKAGKGRPLNRKQKDWRLTTPFHSLREASKIVTLLSSPHGPTNTFSKVNLPEVQKALHANRTNLPYSWSTCSGLLRYIVSDININILPLLKRIIQNNIPVWVYSGDQDSVVPLLGSRTLVRELAEELQFKVTVPYGAWFHKHQVGGWATEYGNLLTFVTVRGAAHLVPYAQPSRALHMFSSFVRGRRLPNTTRPSID